MADADEIKTNGFNGQKVRSFRKQWLSAQEECDKIVGEANAARKERQGEVIEAAEQMGIKRSVFRHMEAEQKALKKAAGYRDKIAAMDGGDKLVDQFDNLKVAAKLPRFDYKTGEADSLDRQPAE